MISERGVLRQDPLGPLRNTSTGLNDGKRVRSVVFDIRGARCLDGKYLPTSLPISVCSEDGEVLAFGLQCSSGCIFVILFLGRFLLPWSIYLGTPEFLIQGEVRPNQSDPCVLACLQQLTQNGPWWVEQALACHAGGSLGF